MANLLALMNTLEGEDDEAKGPRWFRHSNAVIGSVDRGIFKSENEERGRKKKKQKIERRKNRRKEERKKRERKGE